MNWRKPLIYSLLYTSGSRIPKYLKQIKKYEYLSGQQLKELTNNKLEKLLVHAYNNVPYYHKILKECNTVVDGKAKLENFSNIPPLTKEIIREQGKNLYSRDYKSRKPYENTSGGSMGEPVKLIQDRYYQQWNIAHKIYFNLLQGAQIGQRQIKLWGSERDIFKGKEKLSTRLQYWLFNIANLNSFRMSDDIMSQYTTRWNRIKPFLVWTYTSSIFEFGRYLKRSGLSVYSPKAIICTAEVLTEDVRLFLKEVFDCLIVNQYGSREVGPIACECPAGDGLHIFSLQNKVEILDGKLCGCPPGQIGDLYVTALNTYSMPLIRYQIGDTAMPSGKSQCSCKRSWPLISKVMGRETNHFKTKKGEIIYGEYFTHLFYMRTGIKKFQVVQQDYDNVKVFIVPDGQVNNEELQDIENKIKFVIGQDCKVEFDFVDEIQPIKSGKYLYTISKVT
jgi:phenylacetate-CoA ligase